MQGNSQLSTAAAAAMRILVADDHAGYVDVVCALLEWMGHECHSATTGAQAMDLARRIDPHLAFLDISRPYMCGFDVARAIRRSAGGQPYLVAMAGWLHSDHRSRALDAGFDAYVVKPLSVAILEKIVGTPPRPALRVAPALSIVR